MDAHQLQMLILLAPGAILAITFHEVMHGYIANRLGDPTAKLLGRLTLNPFKHIDIFGTILVPALLFISSGMLFGWAKPVPVNIYNLNNPKRDMAIVAAAGPASNLAMAIFASLLLYAFGPFLHLEMGETIVKSVIFPFLMILVFMVQFNLFLMLFNLIPIPPLDGGRIMVGLLPREAALRWAAIEPYGFFILIGLLFLDSYIHIFQYTLYPVMRLLMSVFLPGYLKMIGV